MVCTEKEWKGKKILALEGEGKTLKGEPYPVKVSFGLAKAKLILENIDAIKSFVEKYK